ncbi:DUF3422 family protein [Oceanimonas baumannii]|uniref:Membrane-anchored protein n=1 Tax=Oceanimonas baumannii TaxID=129578 RepID=A0A235CKS3_9GAMM|nr:DUF3422 domain-containing protein [Oceanimonas baumannii]OYD25140.1 hypothetical protein B6S09_05500 [Oceanimonas baumannii]TDW62576.1 putative membrane-anchored protein [Oceanimonas baumannii]
MRSHPLREQIIAEVHARPFQMLQAPLAMLHLAVVYDDTPLEELRQHIYRLSDTLKLTNTINKSRFWQGENEQLALRFEAHHEFYTLTLTALNRLELPQLPQPWLSTAPGSLLCGAEILFRTYHHEQDENAWPEQHFGENQVNSSMVMSEVGQIWTDFYPRPDSGMVRVLVEDRGLQLRQAGRLLQRICEIETYRHVALLALPLANKVVPDINRLETELAELSTRVASEDPSVLLHRLMDLAEQLEALSAQTSNRFSAAEAYFTLVNKRIAELRETRIEGRQTVEQFMDRRLDPATRTCRAAGQRIEQLSRRLARTTQLVRSQVDLSVEQQNRDMLTSLSKRAGEQLRLQAKLESFSIIVVTYYAFDLIDRTLRNLVENEEHRHLMEAGLSISVPFIALLLWLYIRRLLHGVGED